MLNKRVDITANIAIAKTRIAFCGIMNKKTAYQLVAERMVKWCKSHNVPLQSFYAQFRSVAIEVDTCFKDEKTTFSLFALKAQGQNKQLFEVIEEQINNSDVYEPIGKTIITSLKDFGNFSMLKTIFREFEKKALVVPVRIITPQKLSTEAMNRCEKNIKSQIKRITTISFFVDPSLLYGWRVLYGYQEINNSFKIKLNNVMAEILKLQIT